MRSIRWGRVLAAVIGGTLALWWLRGNTEAASVISFVQPRGPMVIASPTGTEVAVQTRIERSDDNRWWQLNWDGQGCVGSSGHSLNGADESTLQPENADPKHPFTIRVWPGRCVLVAVLVGKDGQLRGRATLDLHVCGGESECDH